MGYIPSSTTQNLHAYLTQVGRYNLLFKKASDFQIKYFSLHDNDVNYIIASENINLDFNKLPKGFVPDITGDDVYITEAAIYDTFDELVAVGKLNNPVKKNTNKLFTIELDMDF